MGDDLDGVVIQPELQDRRTTPDYIADALRTAILTGVLSDGAVLNQVATAERFGVSRVPVREAMRQLQAEGLVSSEAHRQVVVRSFSIDSITELCELRALIEAYLVERALPKIDEALLEKLNAMVDGMDGAVDDHREWLRLHGEFHSTLYEASGASMAIELAQGFRGRVERYLNLWSHGRGVDRSREAGREHRMILLLVQGKNVAGAREAVRNHVMATLEFVQSLYERRLAEGGDGPGRVPDDEA